MLKLSVAMCTYNGAAYLREQLASIVGQTRPPDELVICDDCSTDGTRKIIENFAHAAAFPVRLQINARNLGSTKNFEQAIKLCRGELIALADQDDVWYPPKLEQAEKIFDENSNVGLVFSDADIVDDNLRPLGKRLWTRFGFGKREQHLFKQGKALDLLLKRNTVTGATMTFRESLRHVVLPIPPMLVHDEWIAIATATTEAELAFINEPLMQYRQHAQQQIGAREQTLAGKWAKRRNKYPAEKYLIMTQSLLKNLCEHGSDDDYRADVIGAVKDKQIHVRTRMNLPTARLRRVPPIVKEVLRGRYYRYSNGLQSAAQDLLN